MTTGNDRRIESLEYQVNEIKKQLDQSYKVRIEALEQELVDLKRIEEEE